MEASALFNEIPNSGVSTSIKACNFARLLRSLLSISVASNSKLDPFPKKHGILNVFHHVLDRIYGLGYAMLASKT